MSVIWSPKQAPPDPKSILPWSEEAELIWEHIMKTHRAKSCQTNTIDSTNYYNSIYQKTFGTPLPEPNYESNSGYTQHQSSQSITSHVTGSGFVHKIIPVGSIPNALSQMEASYQVSSNDNEPGKDVNTNCIRPQHLECMKLHTDAPDDQPNFDLDVFTQGKENDDYSQPLFSQLESQRDFSRTSNDDQSIMSSPPLDLSPDNETFVLLSQRYSCLKSQITNKNFTGQEMLKHDLQVVSTPINTMNSGYRGGENKHDKHNTVGEQSPIENCQNNLLDISRIDSPISAVDTINVENKSAKNGSNFFDTSISKRLKEFVAMEENADQLQKRKIDDHAAEIENKMENPATIVLSKKSFSVPIKRKKLTPGEFADKSMESTKQITIDRMLPYLNKACSSKQSLVKGSETNLKHVVSMTDISKETLVQNLLSAEEVAMTMLYEDGSSQLRENVEAQKKKSFNHSKPSNLAIAYPMTSDPESSLSCKLNFVAFPMDLTESSDCYHFCRDTLATLFASRSRKLCFEAQEAIAMLLETFSYSENQVCTSWNVLDPKVAGWLLNPDHPPITFKHVLMPYPDLNQTENEDVCSDLSLLGPAMLQIYQRLKQQELWQIFLKLEMPLVPILAVMETRAIAVNPEKMLEMSMLLKKKLSKLEQQAYKLAGQPFNVNSHPQLRVILFEKLQLDLHLPKKKVSKTTSHGNKSTSEAVLTQLSEVHPLPKLVLEQRQLQKLKSTYIDGMMAFVTNNELRTHWDQTAAATGRLTSTNPNIQSVPKQAVEVTDVQDTYVIGKDPLTIQICARAPFVSRIGCTLLAADFKQIELRILAHLSEDEKLLNIFNDKVCQDIFIELTSDWLGKSANLVTPEEREETKRVVYSVMYGVGKERLSEYLKTSSDAAKGIMQSFLLTYPGINTFSKTCIEQAQKHRYQTTILKRRRYLPNINSERQQLKAQSERQAVNFCVQGSAADLCKVAMIQVELSLQKSEILTGRLLFQIHDELLFEVPDSQLNQTAALVKSIMESSEGLCGNILKLKVPLEVSLRSGKSWGELNELKL